MHLKGLVLVLLALPAAADTRVRLIGEMRHDLQLDEEAIDVVLPLLDQVYTLRGSLRTFLSVLEDESESVRKRIARRLRDRLKS